MGEDLLSRLRGLCCVQPVGQLVQEGGRGGGRGGSIALQPGTREGLAGWGHGTQMQE